MQTNIGNNNFIIFFYYNSPKHFKMRTVFYLKLPPQIKNIFNAV